MDNQVFQLNFGVVSGFIIRGKKIALVDTGINITKERYNTIFNKLNIRPADIDLIIITHGHSDHYAHVHDLKEMTGAKILCHENAASLIKNGENAKIIPRNLWGKIAKKIFKGTLKNYVPEEPDIVFNDEFTLYDYGIDGRVVYTPGHSNCSISVLLDSGEAITGDIFVSWPIHPHKPFVALFVEDMDGLITSINRLLDFGVIKFYSGHGGPYTRDSITKLVTSLQ